MFKKRKELNRLVNVNVDDPNEKINIATIIENILSQAEEIQDLVEGYDGDEFDTLHYDLKKHEFFLSRPSYEGAAGREYIPKDIIEFNTDMHHINAKEVNAQEVQKRLICEFI